MKALCANCGKEFNRKKSLIERAKNPTCSVECRNEMYKTAEVVNVECVICGNNIKTDKAMLKHRPNPVCSNDCKKKLISKLKSKELIQLTCPVCGKDFKVYPYRMKGDKSLCCTVSCASKLQLSDKTNHPMYNPNVTEEDRIKRRHLKENTTWRNEVMNRDNYTCDICGKHGGKLQVHHLNGYHWDKENRFNTDNGITLCYECHNSFHVEYGKFNNTKEQYFEYVNLNRRLHKV